MYSLLWLTFLPFLASQACYSPDTDRLEILFLQTVHDQHWYHVGDTYSFFKNIGRIGDDLTRVFPGASFSLGAYQDYGNPSDTKSDRSTCLRLYEPMNLSGAYAKSIKRLDNDRIRTASRFNDNYDSSLSAVGLAATHLAETGFSTGWRSDDGKRIVRIIVLITDAQPYTAQGSGSKQPTFVGDGTDTCENQAPTLAKLSEILADYDVSLIVETQGDSSYLWWTVGGKQALGDRLLVRGLGSDESAMVINREALIKSLTQQICTVVSWHRYSVFHLFRQLSWTSSTSTTSPPTTTETTTPSTTAATTTSFSTSQETTDTSVPTTEKQSATTRSETKHSATTASPTTTAVEPSSRSSQKEETTFTTSTVASSTTKSFSSTSKCSRGCRCRCCQKH